MLKRKKINDENFILRKQITPISAQLIFSMNAYSHTIAIHS